MGKIRFAAVLGALCCLLLLPLAKADPAYRALIITSDYFVTMEDTGPCATNNGRATEQIFFDEYVQKTQTTVYQDDICSQEALEQAILEAFKEAEETDVSYLYLSTHGVLDEEPYLILSNGVIEYHLTAQALKDLLDPIKGTKILVIDACHSGSFIKKGTSALAAAHPFTGDEYKLITSAGGDEQSWFWYSNDSDGNTLWGSGYFSDILSLGLSSRGGFAADHNRDGEITLSECYQYLLSNHGASTPRVYPQSDAFVMLRYDLAGFLLNNTLPQNAIGAITFSNSVLNFKNPSVSFEFTAYRPAKIAYRLIYQRNGQWDFRHSRLLYDIFETDGDYGDEKGAVAPGRKTRSLQMELNDNDTYGYVLMQLLSLTDSSPVIHFSRSLAVPRPGGNPNMSLNTLASFTPELGEEMPIHLSHQSPLEISLSIVDKEGTTVKRLFSHCATRPEQLNDGGSVFYWDGKQKDGTLAPTGAYQAVITAYYPEETYTAYSEFFQLAAPNG